MENVNQDLLNIIEQDYREEFQKLVETGEANDDFYEYLDRTPECQKAVEEAFARQAKPLEDFAEELHAVQRMNKPFEEIVGELRMNGNLLLESDQEQLAKGSVEDYLNAALEVLKRVQAEGIEKTVQRIKKTPVILSDFKRSVITLTSLF